MKEHDVAIIRTVDFLTENVTPQILMDYIREVCPRFFEDPSDFFELLDKANPALAGAVASMIDTLGN